MDNLILIGHRKLTINLFVDGNPEIIKLTHRGNTLTFTGYFGQSLTQCLNRTHSHMGKCQLVDLVSLLILNQSLSNGLQLLLVLSPLSQCGGVEQPIPLQLSLVQSRDIRDVSQSGLVGKRVQQFHGRFVDSHPVRNGRTVSCRNLLDPTVEPTLHIVEPALDDLPLIQRLAGPISLLSQFGKILPNLYKTLKHLFHRVRCLGRDRSPPLFQPLSPVRGEDAVGREDVVCSEHTGRGSCPCTGLTDHVCPGFPEVLLGFDPISTPLIVRR